MRCPKCQVENRETRKFCAGCGAKLALPCPHCSSENFPGEKFCGECGQSLTISTPALPKELSFDEKLRKIQKYLPGGLTEKILAKKGKIEGELKQVTVLFADMENFTPLVEKIGPEEAYAIMDQVYEILIHKVHEFEGTVNEMTGDGIMALFGAPIALEDAPQRAIRSALAIHQEITKFSDRTKQEKGIPPIKMRIGIHTGPVVVGTLGNDLRVEFKAVGDTVNLASRIQNLAQAGTTYTSEDTFKLTEGFFRFESLGSKEIKGREESEHIYQVIAATSARTRFEVSSERGLTPFIGRAREVELLVDCLERTKEGQGQVFSIIGEAGVGKSRVLYEFRKAISNEDITLLEGRCLSYERGSAFHPIRDILKAAFEISEGDPDTEIQDKVHSGLDALQINANTSMSYILELLGVKESGIEKISLSPEGKKDAMIQALKEIIIKNSVNQTIVLTLEDLHWADSSSADVLKYLMDAIPASRVFLIFTYRPEYTPVWERRSYHNALTINRLSQREILQMVAHLLGSDRLDKNLIDFISIKTEGVPFFIEEFIKSLKDLKIIQNRDGAFGLTQNQQTLAIPSTLKDVIMARVDALPAVAKELIQIGSVIEREFGYEIVKQATGFGDSELSNSFSILKENELLYERGIIPQSSYIFKHALTRDVVYDSLLTKKKKTIHQKIGQTMEGMYKESLEPQLGALASHFMEGDDFSKGEAYFKRAMRRAEKSGLLRDSITYGQKRTICIEKLPPTEENQRKSIDARATLGLYISQLNHLLADVRETIDPALDLAEKLKYNKRLSQLLTTIGTYYSYVEEDIPRSFESFERSLKIAEDVNDVVTLSLGSFLYGFPLSFDCQFEKAATHFQKGIDINTFFTNTWGVASMKGTLSIFCYYYPGKIREGLRVAGEAMNLAEQSGDTFSKGIVYSANGAFAYAKGDFEEAERLFIKAVDFCKRADAASWLMIAHGCLGLIYYESKQFFKAMEHFNKGVDILSANKLFPTMAALYRVGALKAEVRIHEIEDLDSKLHRCLDWVKDSRLKAWQGQLARYIAEVFMYRDDRHIEEALHWILEAIGANQKNGMQFELGLSYGICSELFKSKGDRLKIQENLGRAVEIMQECGADGWVEKYQKELATLA